MEKHMLDSFKNPPAEYRYPTHKESDRSLPISEMKRAFDRLAAAGLDTEFPCDGGANRASLPHYKLFADYAARVRYALAQGRRVAQVAILKPAAGHIDALISEYIEIYREYLPKVHIDCEFVDEQTIRRATAVDQRLMISGDQYEMLILPPMASIAYETAIKIEEFVDDGGRVMAALLLPTEDSNGERHEEIRSIFAEIFGKDSGAILVEAKKPTDMIPILRDCICKAIKATVSIRCGGSECQDITYTHRACADEDIFFFANSSREAREVQLSIRCDRAPHILDPESGERIALINCTQQGNRTILLHRFEPCGSLMLGFTDELSFAVPTPPIENGDELTLPNQWDFSLDNSQQNTTCCSQIVIIPEFLRSQRVLISAEGLGDVIEFIINGASAGVRPWPPFETEITALVKPGPNEITLKITNSLSDSSHLPNLLENAKIVIY
ncbi:MAG: glycosyl hydrolase [Armatimonadota bacterium]